MARITAAYREAALRRGVLLKTSKDANTAIHLTNAAAIELANLGFLVNPTELSGMSVEALQDSIKLARKVIGADRKMKPIYPGFPEQVEDLDTVTLLVEQILHYWTAGAFLPNHPDVVREGLPLQDMLRNARKVSVLSAAATARELTRQLTTNAVAISVDDKSLLKGSIELQHPDLALVSEIAKDSRNGENLQTFVKLTVELTALSADELLAAVVPFTDNADQLLRVVLALYAAPSAAKWEDNFTVAVENLADRNSRAVRMGKLNRAARRAIVTRLGKLTAGFKADSLVSRRELWRTVMRAVHPFDLKLTDAEKRAADIIHENFEYRTFNSQVEAAMEKGKVKKAVKLLAENQPGNLLRRVVALLRLVRKDEHAEVLADALATVGSKAKLSTLISAYNGIISANDDHTRVTRVAGLNNTMVDRKKAAKVSKKHLNIVVKGIKKALAEALKGKEAPKGAVAVVSTVGVPLVRRDASTADRILDRGQEVALAGDGDVLRVFGHWNNNQASSGYMDIGVVILDEDFEQIAVSTWNSWMGHRDWSTYSGDKLVYPGDSAPEFIDVKLEKLRKKFPKAKWAAMTVQSWSGWPIDKVDFIAGAMLRSEAQKGEVFDARSVATAFKPTTSSTQAVPFAVNLETGSIVWVDSSNGSTDSGSSSTNDDTIGSIVYDEIARPRLTFGELAKLWASAHGAKTKDAPADRELLLGLLD
jgi:hypothetical protein